MKRVLAAVWIGCMLLLTAACGAKEPPQTQTRASQDTTGVSATEATQTETTEAARPVDWETEYKQYLKVWKAGNAELPTLEEAEYAFVPLQGLDAPVMVLYDGWKICSLYTIENGQAAAVRDSEDSNVGLLTKMPVYKMQDRLYFIGGSGAPACYMVNEVSVRDGRVVCERIASAVYASAVGHEDYFNGRGDAEITESEYDAIVEEIETNGEAVAFSALADLKG